MALKPAPFRRLACRLVPSCMRACTPQYPDPLESGAPQSLLVPSYITIGCWLTTTSCIRMSATQMPLLPQKSSDHMSTLPCPYRAHGLSNRESILGPCMMLSKFHDSRSLGSCQDCQSPRSQDVALKELRGFWLCPGSLSSWRETIGWAQCHQSAWQSRVTDMH